MVSFRQWCVNDSSVVVTLACFDSEEEEEPVSWASDSHEQHQGATTLGHVQLPI